MNDLKIAAALRVLALAFESDAEVGAQPGAAIVPEPQKRGRGRPAKGEDTVASSGTKLEPVAGSAIVATTATPEADPFDPPAAPVATLDEVRAALKGLAAVTSQEKALGVLKTAGGAANLTDLKAEKYGVVVAAVNVELRIIEAAKPAPAVEADPFETTTTAAEPAAKTYTLEDVKAEVVKASKRTSADTVAKVVMDLGGKAPIATGGFGPSWKALPVEKYAEAIAAIQALPTTK